MIIYYYLATAYANFLITPTKTTITTTTTFVMYVIGIQGGPKNPDWKVNWIEVLTICWRVFWVDKTPIDESAGKQLHDVNVARR